MTFCDRCRAGMLVVVAALLGGCGALDAAGGVNKAQYVLPKEKRVLVFVDVDPTVTAPAGFATQLGEAISEQLFKYKAIENPVGQGKLNEMRTDPDKFGKLHIGDVARATDADIVVYVELINFDISTLSDDSLTQGKAQSLVKVLDSNGKRLWPSNVAGVQIDASADPVFTESRDKSNTAREISTKLARDVGRQFRSWYRNENGMKNE